MLTREELRKAKLRRESVRVPALDGDVFVRGLTGAELDAWQQESFLRREKSTNGTDPLCTAALVTRSVCDDNGVRLYKDSDVGEVAELPAEVLAPLYETAAKLSGITKEAKDEIAKNLPSGQSDDST